MAKKYVHEAVVNKEPSQAHSDVAVYITNTTGRAVDPETVALVQRVYPLYLKSDEVKAQRKREAEEREAGRVERERLAEEKARERLEKLEIERTRLLGRLSKSSVAPNPEEVADNGATEVVEDDEDESADEVTLADDWGNDDTDNEEDF